MNKPSLKKVASAEIEVAAPMVVGHTRLGRRQFIPIKGGKIAGEINGNIIDGGADSQIIRANGRTDLSARYVIETNDDELIYIENNGIRQVSERFRDRASKGEIIDPEHVYFRTVPTFETSSEKYEWLENSLFVGAALRTDTKVVLDIYKVL
ncbi:hypothetical protein BEH_12215 [Priestia filamentosa]|uniref:UPF0311 protein BEH_12215 n=1 Tax=Priestia filamentosa TaxID=1402861 RepID=A0A1X7ECN7_9BACI|nr:DUF3237 domain-containing protein [Priestia filamentosa]AKO92785.1 hypothetical protein BEH_12215 [Priestia filamentosa]MDT3762819.1 DUF3237 domain-containing protein [Priestia filamentosa]OXS69354.1 hypothetical protein B1B01_10290 [Priestia filamentosa]WCM13917.1 DUF3237 domain-containing protein [Priestia filamentosa]WRU97271.1 DUF3237 domain-containing protein [Priestia filamentosa]